MSAMRMELLFASDVHFPGSYGEIIGLANTLGVDGMVFGGDYIDMNVLSHHAELYAEETKKKVQAERPESLEELVQNIDGLKFKFIMENAQQQYAHINKALGEAQMPVFGIDGNHDLPEVARKVMTNMHLVDNGDIYDFNGLKFGCLGNTYETPKPFGDLLDRLQVPLEALMPQIDQDYSIHDSKIAQKFMAENPDIILSHKPFGDELNMVHLSDGRVLEAGSGPKMNEYIGRAGKDVLHGHHHGQIKNSPVGDGSLPIGLFGNSHTYRATPHTVWKYVVDDITKKATEVILYERLGELDGKWVTWKEYKIMGGRSAVIN